MVPGDGLREGIETHVVDERMLTVNEAAEILGLDRSSICRMCRNGQLIGAKKFGHVWMVPHPIRRKGYTSVCIEDGCETDITDKISTAQRCDPCAEQRNRDLTSASGRNQRKQQREARKQA